MIRVSKFSCCQATIKFSSFISLHLTIMSEPEYKLIYFDTQGLAEPIRYIFALNGVKYVDERLPKDEHWPYLIPEVKARFPWGTVPVLEYKGIVISQSIAITRFLARKFNLVGADEFESAKCDEIVDSLKDFMNEWMNFFYSPDFKTKEEEMRAKLIGEWNPKFYKAYNNILAKNQTEGLGDWIVGKSLTWADICLAHNMLKFGTNVLGLTPSTTHLEGYPYLKKHVETFHALPAIKKWMDERPKTI